MSQPTVSIIVPVYNTEAYLGECLDSALGQTLGDLEVLCVDNGSTDASPAILRSYAERDDRVRILEFPGGGRGPGAARNHAIERARGQYAGFLDSDDLLAPTMLRSLYDAAEASGADIAIGKVEKFSEQDAEERFRSCSYARNIPHELDDRAFTWADIADRFFDLRFTACNKLYARSFLDEHGIRFSEGIFYEDLNFTYPAMLRAGSMRFVREVHYLNRRQRPGATTFTQGSRVFDAFAAMEDLERFLRSDTRFAALLERFEAFRFTKLRKYLYKNDPKHMVEFYERLQAVARSPEVADNPYLDDVDRQVRDRVASSSVVEFLTADIWEVRNDHLRARRRANALAKRNAALEKRLSSAAPWTVGRILRGVRWRAGKLLRRVGLRRPQPSSGSTSDHSSRGRPPAGAQTPATGKGDKPEQQAKKDPFSGYPRESTPNLYDAVDFLRSREVVALQSRVETRIRERLQDSSEQLRLGLVVNEAAKWNASSLVEAIAGEERIEATIYLTWYPIKTQPESERLERFTDLRRFFEGQGLPVVELYDRERALPLPIEDVEADVLLLQQPWGMKDYPRRLVDRTLTTYLHYGFMMMANHGMHYNIGSFHAYLWRYFAQTEDHRLLHIQHDPAMAQRIAVTGYPKLDVYLEPPPTTLPDAWRRTAPGEPNKRIVFAPHHALGKDNLGMSTFRWNHEVMLRLAQDHPQLQWVYKPHPNLRYAVVRNKVMTREEYLAYEGAWADLPNGSVYDTGGYFDIFRTSDALITDSGSFLAEYLPTGRPILWLDSDRSVGLNDVGLSLAEGYYRVTSPAELEPLFEQVVLADDDPLEGVRKERSQRLFPGEGRAADRVVAHLKETLELT